MPSPPPIPPSVYETVIKRIRDKCSAFEKRVGGTAELSTAYKTVAASDIAVPQCWVVPLYEGDESQEIVNDEEENPQHKVAEYFSTIVAVDNSEGIGGKELLSLRATAALEHVRRQLREALMGWRILPRFTPIRLSRGDHLAMNAKYLWHVWEWRYSEVVTPGQDTALADQIANVVNGMNDVPSAANSLLPRLRHIHIGFRPVPAHEPIVEHDSLRDYYDERPAPTAPSEEDIAAAILGHADEIEVNVAEHKPPLPPSAAQIGSAVFHSEHFDDFWLHGTETVETQAH